MQPLTLLWRRAATTRNWTPLAALLLLVLGVAPAAAQVLRLGGSSGGIGTLKLLVDEFGKHHPGAGSTLTLDLSSGGGIKAVAAAKIDIAVASRPLSTAELEVAAQLPIGDTPFVFITAAGNPVEGISTTELEAIYGGTRDTWHDGRRLRLVITPHDDKDNAAIASISPGMARALALAQARPGMLIEPNDHAVAAAIERIPASLGTSTLALLITEGRPLKALAFNGVVPSANTLADGKYPLTKSYFLVTARQPTPRVKQFIEFVKSRQGKAILTRAGFVAR